MKPINNVCSAALAVMLPASAIAQSGVPIDIPAQPMTDAITELAEQTGAQISSSSKLVSGQLSTPVEGVMTPDAALAQILSDTRFEVTRSGRNGFFITDPIDDQVVAQQLVEDAPLELGTLVLRGELIDRKVQDSQTSAAITTGEQLERRNITSAVDLLNRTANASSAFGDDSISIRGVQERGVGNAGLGRTITITVDGARLTDFGARTTLLSTWDLEQVEVLRGPQSTQSGRNALAGAVIVRSRDPEFFPEYRLRLGYGQNDTGLASFVLNTPLVNDRLAIRFSGDFRQSDGDIFSPTRGIGDYDFSEETNVRASVRWEPTDQLSAILKYSFSDISDAGRATVSQADFLTGSRFNRFDAEEFSKRKLHSTNLRLNYNITPEIRLESETTYTKWDRDNQNDSDFSAFVSPAGRSSAFGEVFQQELRLRYETNNLRAVAGLFFADIDSGSGGVSPGIPAFLLIPNAPPTATIDFATDSTIDTINYAVFGEVEYAFAPRWTVVAGARYDFEETDLSSSVSLTTMSPGLILPPPPPATLASSSDDVFLPKLGIKYDLTDDSSLGFTVQRGYRSGGARSNPFVGASSFDPEFTTNYELAYRSSFYQDRLILNANAYYTDWTDQQILALRPGGTGTPTDTITTNAGRSTLWGGELEVEHSHAAISICLHP